MRCHCDAATALLVVLAVCLGARACGPGRRAGSRRGPRKLTPLVFKQHVPNVPENTLSASGLTEGRIDRNDTRFRDLVPNYNEDIIFKDEEGTGADRLMTQRCKERLNTLAISVMNQWPGERLLVTEGWDEEKDHSPESLHYEGRAVDITTSDRDRSKYGMLARLAVEAGFDWVYYESRSHIHCSVKSESSQAAKYGGCFSGDSTVQTADGQRKPMSALRVGEKILVPDKETKRLVYSEVVTFLDYSPSEVRTFAEVRLESGRTLTVTPTHLVFKGGADRFEEIYAGNLVKGDILLIRDVDNVLNEDKVVGVRSVRKRGVYAPLTAIGSVVVNDVIASCYAVVDSQAMAHGSFAPLRFTIKVRGMLLDVWYGVKGMFGSGQRADDSVYSQPVEGVHWYAKVLYSIANLFIPGHVH